MHKQYDVMPDGKVVELSTGGIGAMFPDYANMESTNLIPTASATWTADRNGYVRIGAVNTSGAVGFQINGKFFPMSNGGSQPFQQVMAVSVGDVVSMAIYGTGTLSGMSCLFIPPKVVMVDTGSVDYSLNETWTGKRWVNGKKIYQKTLDFGALPNATTKIIDHNISNVEQVIDVSCFGFRSSDGNTIKLPYVGSTTSFASCVAGTSAVWCISVGANWQTYMGYVTLQYTCTDR